MLNQLLILKQQKKISESDFYFAKLIADKQQPFNYSQEVQHIAILLAALCHYTHQQGHSCIYLNDLWKNNLLAEHMALLQQIHSPIQTWQTQLLQAKHIAFTEQPEIESVPFIFQNNCLYLHRVWQDEKTVADYFLQAMNETQYPPIRFIQEVINQIYSHKPRQENEIDWQKIAVAMAIKQRFTFISGGPGTGKTTTVTSLLLALQMLRIKQRSPLLKIKLVAPTGKAATRLVNSIVDSLQKQDLASELKSLIPNEASTIHRLLGVKYLGEQTKYNAMNPLSIDVLVVDEISMIDLSLMAKLLRAIRSDTKLILLGDKDQLTSVEAGAVISELSAFINTGEQRYSADLVQYLMQSTGINLPVNEGNHFISDHLCHLERSHRFTADSGIGKLAQLIKTNQNSWSFLQSNDDKNIRLMPYYSKPQALNITADLALIQQQISQYYQVYFNKIRMTTEFTQDTVKDIFIQWKSIGILTALRVGEFGVESLNQMIAEHLKKMGMVNFTYERDWYIGKPIIITENAHTEGIFNGDIGLFLGSSKEDGKVWFESGKSLSVTRIPKYEVAFAITVHKSQGSEFEHTVLVLPPKDAPVLSKELIYTAITRAKTALTIFCSHEIWKKAVKRETIRQSGLTYWLKNYKK